MKEGVLNEGKKWWHDLSKVKLTPEMIEEVLRLKWPNVQFTVLIIEPPDEYELLWRDGPTNEEVREHLIMELQLATHFQGVNFLFTRKLNMRERMDELNKEQTD